MAKRGQRETKKEFRSLSSGARRAREPIWAQSLGQMLAAESGALAVAAKSPKRRERRGEIYWRSWLAAG